MLYLYMLAGLSSFSLGFCCKVYYFPDERELDEIERIRDYNTYLEEMLIDYKSEQCMCFKKS